MRSFALLSAICAVASAANIDPNKYQVIPGNIPASDRGTWCTAQFDTCGIICRNAGGGPATTNDCDTTTLKFSCTCPDGNSPDVSPYINTIPTFICTERFNMCIKDTVGDSVAQDQCNRLIREKCGKQDPNKAIASPTSSANPTATSAPASATTSSKPSGAAGSLVNGGNSVLAAALAMAAGFLL